jgi:hypothetical protein
MGRERRFSFHELPALLRLASTLPRDGRFRLQAATSSARSASAVLVQTGREQVASLTTVFRASGPGNRPRHAPALRRIRVPVPPVPHCSLRDVAVLAALRAV